MGEQAWGGSDIASVRAPALIRSNHLVPCVVISAIMTMLAVGAGLRGIPVVLLGLAALAGQFSIGWSNDVFDAARDATAGRLDKPIVAGAVGVRTVLDAALAALALSIVCAFAVSIVTGLIHLVMMAAGWTYNAWLKSTLASGLMYLLGFGLIPVFAASALPGNPLPPPWTVVAAALLGLGAHFLNVLPDLAGDRLAGVQGLPQRLAATRHGEVLVRLVAVGLLLGATVLIVLGPGPPYRPLSIGALILAVLLGGYAAAARGRRPFFAAVGIAVLDTVLFVLNGSLLT